jgi:hypothetical protein
VQRVEDDVAERFDNRSDEAIEILLLRKLTQSVRKLGVAGVDKWGRGAAS